MLAAYLSPNRRRGVFISESAILVKRQNRASQIWSMEKFENNLIEIRELYQEWEDREQDSTNNINKSDLLSSLNDPFYESQENHQLIGVANIFLEILFHNVMLEYHVPIIS
jgi:kinesin family protein 13